MGLLGPSEENQNQRSSEEKKKNFEASEATFKTLAAFCFIVVREIKFGFIILGRN